MGRKPLELTGQRFGRLTVLDFAYNDNGNTYWECLCDCGNRAIVRGVRLKNGRTRSCGCIAKEIVTKRNKERASGLPRDKRLYRIYHGMKTRCYNSNEAGYMRYGGRGITMCREWKDDFQSFQEWAFRSGYNSQLTIDRIDNDGDYSPSNCRWASIKQQGNNRRSNILLIYNGEQKTVSEWSDVLGIKRNTIYQRLRNGWSAEDALSIPIGMYKGGKDVHIPLAMKEGL